MSKKNEVKSSEVVAIVDPVSQADAPVAKKGPRSHGKGKGLTDHTSYFPPIGSICRSELDRIAASAEMGVPVSSFRLTEIFLGKLVAAELVNVTDGTMFASERCMAILSGDLVLESNRTLGTGVYSLFRQIRDCTDSTKLAELGQKLAEAKAKAMSTAESAAAAAAASAIQE